MVVFFVDLVDIVDPLVDCVFVCTWVDGGFVCTWVDGGFVCPAVVPPTVVPPTVVTAVTIIKNKILMKSSKTTKLTSIG